MARRPGRIAAYTPHEHCGHRAQLNDQPTKRPSRYTPEVAPHHPIRILCQNTITPCALQQPAIAVESLLHPSARLFVRLYHAYRSVYDATAVYLI